MRFADGCAVRWIDTMLYLWLVCRRSGGLMIGNSVRVSGRVLIGRLLQFRYPLAALLLVMLAFGLSLAFRIPAFREATAQQGLEASYHVLWTAEALKRSPASSHHYLPTVTLDPDRANPRSWGATVGTPSGSFVYTSFPPLGFLIPAIVVKGNTAEARFLMLALFNAVIGLSAALLLAGLTREAALASRDEVDADGRDGWVVFGFTAICYLFLRESLVSHGPVYWPHSLSQLSLIAGSWSAYRLFKGHGGVLAMAVLALSCTAYALLEWTGYVFNFGVFLALGYVAFRRRRELSGPRSSRLGWAAAVVAVVTVGAIAFTLMQYVSAIGADRLLHALSTRAGARHARIVQLAQLPIGYFISFGALLPLAALAAWKAYETGLLRKNGAVAFLMFVTTFPVIENILLTQHAVEFSFDRLKFAVPLLIISGVMLYAERIVRSVVLVFLGMYLIISSNIQIFANDQLYYREWGAVVRKNKALRDAFETDPLAGCAIFTSPMPVRGYLGILFDRDIYENTRLSDLRKERSVVGDCGFVEIKSENIFQDLPRLRSIEIFDPEGRMLRRYLPGS